MYTSKYGSSLQKVFTDYALYEYSLEEIIKSEDMDHICAISKKNLKNTVHELKPWFCNLYQVI